MKTLGNILWFVLAGVWTALGWLFWALILACTVVGIPFARQCVKLAVFSAWPFGRQVVPDPTASKLGAVLWFIPGALMALGYVLAGIALCITVVAFPFGLQSFKLAGLALAPFGKKIVTTSDARAAFAPS
jgi:uncharacterized membrane protein YccF (DUF307 family)